MATAVGKKVRRVLRCFCNCTELTEADVKNLYRLDPSSTLIDELGAKMLRSFLEKKYPAQEEQEYPEGGLALLKIYEKCTEYLAMTRIPAMNELDALDELGLRYRLLKDLKEHIRTGDRTEIDGCLTRIQGECCKDLEAGKDFKEYKREILKKLDSLE